MGGSDLSEKVGQNYLTINTASLTVGVGKRVNLNPEIMNFIRKSPYAFLDFKEFSGQPSYLAGRCYGICIIGECVFFRRVRSLVQKTRTPDFPVRDHFACFRIKLTDAPFALYLFLFFITPFVGCFVCIVGICFLVVGFCN